MAAATLERASLVDLFDQHATLHIDDWAYQQNPILQEAADRLAALAGLTAADVTKAGITMYRTHAAIEVFERTADGTRIIHNGVPQSRTVIVEYDGAP